MTQRTRCFGQQPPMLGCELLHNLITVVSLSIMKGSGGVHYNVLCIERNSLNGKAHHYSEKNGCLETGERRREHKRAGWEWVGGRQNKKQTWTRKYTQSHVHKCTQLLSISSSTCLSGRLSWQKWIKAALYLITACFRGHLRSLSVCTDGAHNSPPSALMKQTQLSQGSCFYYLFEIVCLRKIRVSGQVNLFI